MTRYLMSVEKSAVTGEDAKEPAGISPEEEAYMAVEDMFNLALLDFALDSDGGPDAKANLIEALDRYIEATRKRWKG